MKIEFFHDTICSFCFPMSYKMRIIAEEMLNLEIVHRSFSLSWEKSNLIDMSGSLENAKNEILEHWKHANETDPLRRFNIEGMRNAGFDFPTSKNPLLASKAAGILWGESCYWDLFDAMQRAMFTESRDISSVDVIGECVRACDLDFDAWEKQFHDPSTMKKVQEDLELVLKYCINSVPTLIVDGKHKISGSLPMDKVKSYLMELGYQTDK